MAEKRTAQEMVDGFPKGSGKNRAQHVLEKARSEGQVIAAYEVLSLMTDKKEDPFIQIKNIESWANLTIETGKE